jgi:NTE family protein
MYSVGYSADSIHKLLNLIDLNGAIANKIPENKIIFLEKRHFQNSIMSLPVSHTRVRLPKGLSNGQVIENFLSYYAWPAADINDFLKLPIPFMCVGADILTDRIVDIKNGYLPDAIRASIAIPSVFTPIKIDSSLLLDGGIIRNFPAREVIDMGADIVIGSYTGFRWRTEEGLESVSDIIKQISLSRGYNDFVQQKKFVRYLIIPDLKGLSSADFSKVDSIYERGYKAALPFKDKFITLADSLNKLGARKPLVSILKKEYYSFDRIEITGNDKYSDRQIMGVLDISTGEKVNKDMLGDRIDMLYGKAWFEKIKYRIEPRNDSLILVIECTERPNAMFYGAVHYDNALGAGALISISLKNLLTSGTVVNLDSYIGQYYRFMATFLKYIDWKQRYGLSADFYADNTLVPILHLKSETGEAISRNLSAGLSISRRIGLNHMARISGEFENLNLMPRFVSVSDLSGISYNYIKTTFSYSVNSLDSKHFPDKGLLFDFTGSSSRLLSAGIRTESDRTAFDRNNTGDFSFDRFYILRTGFKQYFSPVRKFTFSMHADALYISRCDSAISRNNFCLLGGIRSLNERSIPMAGFHPNEIPVQSAAGAGFEIDFEFYDDLHLLLMSDFFAIHDIYRGKGFSMIAGAGAGLGYMSVIGPMKVGIMYGKDPEREYFNRLKGYISIGYNF